MTNSSDASEKIEGHVATFWACAPDSDLARFYPNAICLKQLLEECEESMQRACLTVKKILQGEPLLRGLPHLAIFQEVLVDRVRETYRILGLHNFLVEEGFQSCEFPSSSWISDQLVGLQRFIDSPLAIKVPATAKSSKLQNMLKRLKVDKFSINTVFNEFLNVINYVDPFHYRSMFKNKIIKSKIQPNLVWSFSAGENYTNTCLEYEPFFDKPLNFLVENERTGGVPLRRQGRIFDSIYLYALPKFVPSCSERKSAAHAIRQHIENLVLEGDENIARIMLLNHAWLHAFCESWLPRGLFHASIFEHWINLVKPSALVVGNCAFEAYALLKVRERHIPTIILQHGVLGLYYAYLDFPADYYVVRGRFWRDLLSADSRDQAPVLNPMQKNRLENTNLTLKTIIFAPTLLFSGEIELDLDMKSIFEALLRAMDGVENKLIIRIHPRERVDSYREFFNNLIEGSGCKVNIEYSQGDDLEGQLDNAAAVILFASTLFMRCLSRKVPVISFNWIHFGLIERVKKLSMLYYAQSLQDLRSLVNKAAKGELKPLCENGELFFDNTEGAEIRKQLLKITGSNLK